MVWKRRSQKILGANEQGLVSNLYQNKVENFILLNNLGNAAPETKEEAKEVKEEK